jgi:hypothetical protein
MFDSKRGLLVAIVAVVVLGAAAVTGHGRRPRSRRA